MTKTRGRPSTARRPVPETVPLRSNQRPILGALLVALSALSVYAGGLDNPFVFDDRGTIIDNRTIEDLGSAAVLNAPHETPTAGRPVVNVSFAINYAIGGRDVTGYHVGNMLIHVLCALVLYGVVRRSQPSSGVALAVAMLWTVHPLASEAVNYITQRTESLMALAYLLTLYGAIRAHQAPGHRGRWETASIAACLLGMGSKESMVTAPLCVVLYDRLFLFRSLTEAVRERWRLYLGLAATWVVLALLVASAPRNLSAGFGTHDADPWTYLMNQAVMIAQYLRLSIWPRGLVLYYGWPQPLGLAEVLPQAASIFLLLVATIVALARWPRLGFLGASFFLILAPTSSIVPIATEVGAERRMYLPLIPVVLCAVAVGRYLPTDTRVRAAAAAIVAILLGAQTIIRTAEYQSSLRLAETTFERWPSPGAQSMLGTELAAAGRPDEAERHLRAAAAVHPPAQYYLATVLAEQGRRSEAIELFRSFIASQPAELDQVHLARALLGGALVKEGRFDEAAEQFRTILTRSEDAQAAVQLAQIYVRQQRFAEAIPLFRTALAAGENSRTLGSLGVALASSGQLDEAIAALQRAVELDPNNTSAQANLARALALKRP